jgi:EpsI family protein
VIDRRQLLCGGACIGAVLAAEFLRPRKRLSLMGPSVTLEQITPKKFGEWSEVPIGGVLQPNDEGSLSSKLYSQTLGRVYQHASTGVYLMLALAYGDTQSDLLQLHRPETCYPAFGFSLSEFQRTGIELPTNIVLPTRSMVATAPDRVEIVSYWSRLGEFLPTSQQEQRLDKLKTALAGFVPDGILVRSSTLDEDVAKGLAANRSFLHDLILAIVPQHRAPFIGTKLAQALAASAAG